MLEKLALDLVDDGTFIVQCEQFFYQSWFLALFMPKCLRYCMCKWYQRANS